MADGWLPDADRVVNYLRHLAAHQWTADELRDGRVLAGLIGRPDLGAAELGAIGVPPVAALAGFGAEPTGETPVVPAQGGGA
jgi:hypothetical protein